MVEVNDRLPEKGTEGFLRYGINICSEYFTLLNGTKAMS